jgi:hypothetical protein
MTMMNQPDDADAGEGVSMGDAMAEELQRHGDEVANILAEHGVAPDDDGEGSTQD